MGLFSSLIEAQNSRPNEITTSKELDDWLRFGGQSSQSGINVGVDNAAGLPAVAASVRVLSESLAHLPLVLFRRGTNSREPARDLRLYQVLHDAPNKWQTSYQWRKLMMRDLLFRGNAYSLIVGSKTSIQGLIRLHPDRVEVNQDGLQGDITYTYSRDDRTKLELSSARVLHIWFDSDDGIQGISPLKAYRESIGEGIAIRQHGSQFFRNAARITGVLQGPAGTKIGTEATRAMREDFESMYVGNTNAGKTAVLPGGIEFKPVSLSMEDAQWIEAKKMTAREIYGIFGIPPHKAGDLADATFSNIEHENLSFVIDSLMPKLVAWEQAIKRDLLEGDRGFFVKFNTSALLRGDFKSRQEGLQIQRRNGVIAANEWRELEDLNPRGDEGGERYIIEKNMQDDSESLEVQNEPNQS